MVGDKHLNINILYNKFCTTYYVETLAFKIPIIYGNNELFFAHLINSFYNYFIINKSYPILTLDNDINSDNIIVIKRISNMLIKSQRNENETNEIENKELTIENNDNNFSPEECNLFIFKYIKIEPLILKYVSDDFQNDLSTLIKSLRGEKERRRIKFTFLSFFEIFQNLIVNLKKFPKDSELNDLYDFFYEKKDDKLHNLEKMNKLLNINFYYIDDKPIDLKNFKIENKEYFIKINKKIYIF